MAGDLVMPRPRNEPTQAYHVALPRELHARVRDAAAASGKTMREEVIARIADSFHATPETREHRARVRALIDAACAVAELDQHRDAAE